MWCDWGKNLEIWSGDSDTLTQNILFEDIYNIRITHAAIAITVKYGSQSVIVKNVTYRNIFTELDENPLLPLYNVGQGYTRDWANDQYVKHIWVEATQLGKNQGNQGILIDSDVEKYNTEISNLHFEHAKQIGKKRYPSSFAGKNVKFNNFNFIDCDL